MTRYFEDVAARNQEDASARVLESGGLAPQVPSAPTSVVGTSGNGQVSLTWTAPSSDGGSAITDYVVQYRPTWPTAIDVLHPTRRWPLGEASGTPIDAISSEVGAVGGSPSRNVTGPGATGGGIAFANTTTSSPAWANLGYFDTVGNGDDDEVTFSFWLQTTYTGLADVWGCGYYGDNPAFAPIILFEINGSSITGPADGHLTGFFAHTDAMTDPFPGGTSGVIWEINSPTVNFRDGQWHSFAFVYSRTAKTVTVYVDGTAQTISTYHANSATWGTLAPWPNVYIGQGNNDPNPGTGGRPGVPQTASPAGVTGSFDEFAVIPSLITAADAVRIDRAGRGTWTTFSDAVTSSTGAIVTGLTNDVAYEFQVAAVNVNGAGTYSTTSSPVTPAAPLVISLAGTAIGISTTTGTLSVARPLAGTAGGLSTTTGTLAVARALAGSVTGLSSTTTGALIVARTLVGTSGGLSTTTGALAVGRALVGTSDGVSTDTGAIIVARTLAGTSTGQSTVTGDLAGSSAKTLDGSAGGLSTTTGALSVTRGLAGSSDGLSTAGGTALIAQRALVGSAAGLSSTTAALARAVPLAGTAAGLSTTSGSLASAGLPGGLSSAESTATGALTVARALVGTSTGASTTTGALARDVPMAGTATGASTVTGALTVARSLVGSATGISTAGGTALTVARALVGSADGVSTTTASLLATAAGGISGLTSGLSTATGALSVARQLAGTSGGLSGSTGAIAKQIPLASTSAIGQSSAVAAIARGVPLVGTAGGVSTTTAATAVARSLVGSAGGLSSASAPRLVATRTLVGAASGVGDASASTLAINQGLRGSASGASSATGTLQTIRIEAIYGVWNGLAFDAMQYGGKQVVDWMMIPS